LALAAAAPVSLNWTRKEEFTYDSFQCPTVTKIRGGVDADGKLTFWDYQVYYAGDRGAAFPYDVSNYRIRIYGDYTNARPFAGGAWRAPGNNANTFARESHMNALATLTGVDPVQFRLAHLSNPRLRAALLKAAEVFGWPMTNRPPGRGYGVACGVDGDSYTAAPFAYVVMMAEVDVDQVSGNVQVRRVVAVQDMGRVINPDGARQQIEGGVMMGLGYSLSEELHFGNGRVDDVSFVTYNIPRYSWMPKIETVLMPNDQTPPGGGGEPPIITVGAVIADAVSDAIGTRMNRLPLNPERVLAAIRSTGSLALNPPLRTGNQINFTWNGGAGIRLQRCPALGGGRWSDVPGTDGASSVSLLASEDAAFFRLVRL
jgi:CO/xanthine dehydrogenase Mo-binding subunit